MIHRSPAPDVDIPVVSLPDYVFEHARQWADKPALIDGPSGRTLTYGQLIGAASRLAGALAARGFGTGDVFAIFSPNLPEYAIVFFGVQWAGGVVTTTNPTYTKDELGHQLKDAGAKYLITIPHFLEPARAAAEEAGVEELFVFGEAEGATPLAALLAEGGDRPALDLDPQSDLAVQPYSSGTTGLPKGVMLTHYNLVANIAQTLAVEQMETEEVLIGILPFYHIYGMIVILSMALRKGTTIITMPRFDLEQFLGLMQDHKVTTAFVVPPIILALAKHPVVDQYDLSALEQIVSGAAPLPEATASGCAERLGCAVRQGYGLTETSPVTHFIPRNREIKVTSVGFPVPNTEVRIVDVGTDNNLGTDEPGEIWIRGPQVMKGYHNNPEATRDMIDEAGWLHTGDIGYVDDDGYFYVIDRVKELIKYKGLQIAPAELEAVLQGHPAVADAAVIPSPDEEAGEVPKAFIVRKPGSEASAEDIQAYVAERVAPYKKVRRVEFIEQIPKVPSGKILRRELVKREREKMVDGRE
ncbi:MAG TPA: 4-coumarate--CoA ligase family protein [Rhodothermales bacterium]|nr:4-coumarate--CoA ligase family protein [Rhodothermales bacterium]